MDNWEDVDAHFLPLPFTSLASPDGPLLVKLLYHPDTLAVCATDLTRVYFEGLNRRKLLRRIEDALSSGNEPAPEGVTVGIGEDGEALLRRTVDTLMEAVTSGTAKAELTDAGFEFILKLTVKNRFTFTFVTDSLGPNSAAVLATHLITPLLGTTASLLSLLQKTVPDEEALRRGIQEEVDASGDVERRDEGRAVSRFMKLGGSRMVSRWVKRSLGAKEDDIEPLALSLPSYTPRSRSPGPSPSKRRATRSPTTASSPPHKLTAASPSSSARPFSSIAHQMLDHRGGKHGDKVGWDDSQSLTPVPEGSSRASDKGKGRAREKEGMEEDEPPVQVERSADEEEPPTDDEAGSLPPAAQPTPSDAHPASSPPFRSVLSPPPGTADSTYLRSPSHVPPGSQSQRLPPPTPTQGDEDEEDDAAKEAKREAKEAKKKKAKEKEAEEELARRKARLAKMGQGGAKKAVKKRL
ncbi:hypothetical protein JCM8097_001776 [Rhodosporidiobolus ruineniae]